MHRAFTIRASRTSERWFALAAGGAFAVLLVGNWLTPSFWAVWPMLIGVAAVGVLAALFGFARWKSVVGALLIGAAASLGALILALLIAIGRWEG